jgi:hypothetical protein
MDSALPRVCFVRSHPKRGLTHLQSYRRFASANFKVVPRHFAPDMMFKPANELAQAMAERTFCQLSRRRP